MGLRLVKLVPPETSAHKLVQSLAEKLESHDAVLEMGVSEIQSDVFMPVTIDRNREQEVKDEVFAELEVDGHEVEHVEPLAHEQELYTIDVADDMADVVGDTRTVQYIRSAGIKSV